MLRILVLRIRGVRSIDGAAASRNGFAWVERPYRRPLYTTRLKIDRQLFVAFDEADHRLQGRGRQFNGQGQGQTELLFELVQRNTVAGLLAQYGLDAGQQLLLDMALLHLTDDAAFQIFLEQPQEPLQILDVRYSS